MLLPFARSQHFRSPRISVGLFLLCLCSSLIGGQPSITHAAFPSGLRVSGVPSRVAPVIMPGASLSTWDSGTRSHQWASSALPTARLTMPLSVTARGLVFAQRWVSFPWPNGQQINRGPGGYLAWWKLLLLYLMFLLWTKTTDWVSRDCREHNLAYATWIPVVFVPFAVALFAAGMSLPLFAAGAAITFLAWLVPLIVFVIQRNQQMELHQRVMTKDHLRFLGAEYLRGVGINVGGETKAAHEKGAQVNFKPKGGKSDEKNQANFINARQSAGYLPTKEIVHSAVEHRADKIMMDFAPDSLAVKFQVDGVWHDGDDQHDETSEDILEVVKLLSGIEPEQRGKRQSGQFEATVKGEKFNCQMVAQGTKTGERALINMSGAKTGFASLEELGMREKMIEQYKDMMLSDNGILILSAMPSGGLSTALNVSLRSTDRLLRDFISLEEAKSRLEEVENVDPEIYDAAAGEKPTDKLPTLIRKQPDVMIVPDLPDAETAKMICDAAAEDQLVFTTIRAKEGVEALLRVLLLKVPAETFAPVVIGVLNQRLVRVLCPTCKESYEPSPALLKKLGIPAGRVEELFRHPEDPDEVCGDCQGIGYKGRTAIFELVTVDDRMREALRKQPKLDVLRKASRLAGNRTLQEEGIAAVVRGITSLPELMRVLKQ